MMMTKNDDSDSKSDSKGDSTDVNDYIDKNAKLDWNESKFKKLKVGKDSAKSIMKTYCKASDAQMSGDDLNMTYSGKDYSESVYLTFKKQYDGTFILSHASGNFPTDAVQTDDSYKSDWTKEQFDALNKEITATHQTEQNSKVSLRITLKLQTLITPSQQFVKMSSRKN